MSRARKLRRARRWARYLSHYDHLPSAYIEGDGLQRAIRDSDPHRGGAWIGIRSGQVGLAKRYHHRCPVFWGSHGCDRSAGHRGDHQCGDTARDWCERVDRNGRGKTGFQWRLFTIPVLD